MIGLPRGTVLETVDIGRQSMNFYKASVGAEALSQLKALAAPLAGARIVIVHDPQPLALLTAPTSCESSPNLAQALR